MQVNNHRSNEYPWRTGSHGALALTLALAALMTCAPVSAQPFTVRFLGSDGGLPIGGVPSATQDTNPRQLTFTNPFPVTVVLAQPPPAMGALYPYNQDSASPFGFDSIAGYSFPYLTNVFQTPVVVCPDGFTDDGSGIRHCRSITT